MVKKSYLMFFVFFVLLLILPKKAYSYQNASGSSAALETELVTKAQDNRAKILKKFLDKYNSPLAQYSNVFVKKADDYNLDWRLVASISGVESTFGKHIPYNSYNGWGWGVYGDNVIYFSSWEDAIDTVSKGLRENYLNKWKATDIYEIGRIYAASPRWAGNVTYFMEKIREFEYQNQITHLSISI